MGYMGYNETHLPKGKTMFQNIDGHHVFVVEITEPPMTLLPINDSGIRLLRPYADALQDAILYGMITEPGKYAIEFPESPLLAWGPWSIYSITE